MAKKETKWREDCCNLNALLTVQLKQPVVDTEAVMQLDYVYDVVEFESNNQDSMLSQANDHEDQMPDDGKWRMIPCKTDYLLPSTSDESSNVLLNSKVPVGLDAPAKAPEHFDQETQTTSQSEQVDGDGDNIAGSKHSLPFSHNIVARLQDSASQMHYDGADHNDLVCGKCQLKENDDHSNEVHMYSDCGGDRVVFFIRRYWGVFLVLS